ncbi:hypothetical protein GALL_449990 [mine drainage metagenome]|uniref:Uncharacterized protein n=1 Tax=mine drainage metagenome TaxID=410659 RepID=A0A1J5Q0I7_9ZZZZ
MDRDLLASDLARTRRQMNGVRAVGLVGMLAVLAAYAAKVAVGTVVVVVLVVMVAAIAVGVKLQLRARRLRKELAVSGT